jgi:SAM-dependent methyltransferase
MELAKRYGTVIAQDPSQAMLDQAQQHSNVRYEVATAEAMGQADCSVDLVTCAQAMHWYGSPSCFPGLEVSEDVISEPAANSGSRRASAKIVVRAWCGLLFPGRCRRSLFQLVSQVPVGPFDSVSVA